MSKRERDADEMAKFMLRVSKAMVVRAAAGDVAAVVALRDIHKKVNEMLGDAARACHASGMDWSTIAAELGMTKQAAHKRWAETDDE